MAFAHAFRAHALTTSCLACCVASCLTCCAPNVTEVPAAASPLDAPAMISALTPDGEKVLLPVRLAEEVLAKKPHVHAVDLDGDEVREAIIEWIEEDKSPVHRYLVYAAEAGGTYALRSTFGIGDMYNGGLRFLREPDPREPTKAIATVQGGSYWGEYHLIRPEGTGADEVANGMDLETIDLDGDGIAEWVLPQKHNPLGVLKHGCRARSLEVARWDRTSRRYRSVWPPARAGRLEFGTVVCDVDGDGVQEFLALMDTAQNAPGTRRLCLFELTASRTERVAEIDAARPDPPHDLSMGVLADGRLPIIAELEGPDNDAYEFRLKTRTFAYLGPVKK